jgi:hypothetical protein
MRRIARALWERARVWEALEGRRPTGPEQRRELFITMLAQLAYVVPCPADVEAALADRRVSYASPTAVAHIINDRIRRLAADPDAELDQEDLVDRTAAETLEIFEEAQTPPARARTPIEANGRRLRQNARAAMPHPLRLVAASFWPV